MHNIPTPNNLIGTCPNRIIVITSNSMNIGVCLIELEIQASGSLKEKRRVIKSILDRVKNKFNVSIAEVDNNNLWNLATIGVVCISNEGKHSHQVLSKVTTFIQDLSLPIVLLNISTEIINGID